MDRSNVIYRPGFLMAADDPRKSSLGYLYEGTMSYFVTQGEHVVALYHLYYFRTPDEVLADLINLLRDEQCQGPHASDDYAIWFDGRLQAAIHQPMDEKHQRIVRFSDERNAPSATNMSMGCQPGWPSYEQWVADGKGALVYDPKKYPGGY